jgi:hypothetical protein
VKVKFSMVVDVPDNEIFSESNDLITYGYHIIEEDYYNADSCDDFNLEFEIL